MKNIAFIINPISGNKETQSNKRRLPKLIMQLLDQEQWLPNIAFTEYLMALSLVRLLFPL